MQQSKIMAHRNFYKPNPSSYPFHPSNHPNPILQRRFSESSMSASAHTMMLSNPHYYNQYHHCLSDGAGSSQRSPYPYPRIPHCYDQHVNLNGTNVASFQEENTRASYKRKRTAEHPAYQINHVYSAGNSLATPKPMPSCVFPENNNMLVSGEQNQRNVRSRFGDTSFNLSWQPASSSTPHQIYTSVNNSPLMRAPVQFIHPTGSDHSSFATNWPIARNLVNTHSYSVNYSEQCRSQYSTVPNYRIPATRVAVSSPTGGRYRASSSHSTTVFNDFVPFQDEFTAFPSRNGGLRILNIAQHEENARVRWASQGSEMGHVPSYFSGLDLFDEHRDLRLDIDDMGYEELLALEERIGNVNTGLPEGHLSSCLRKSLYCSSNSASDPQQELSCPICLEEYMEKDKIGKMACLHMYHMSCIKNWLRLKNACPICKASALDDNALKNPH